MKSSSTPSNSAMAGADRRLEQGLLGGVVVEHARLRVTGVIGDLLERARGESDGGELLEGGLAQLVARSHAGRGLGIGGHAIDGT